MPEQLPNGWVRTTLGEIVEPSRERVLPAEVPAMPYVGLEHIQPQTMRLLGHETAREVRSSSVRFSKGDVLYGKMRPYLNKVWVAEFDGLCSAEFLVFPRYEGLNSQFLAARLNAEDFVSFANGLVSGERPRVGFEELSRFPVALPPSSEQDRIVEKLQAALTGATRAETAVRRAQERLHRYRAAVLQAAVTGEVTVAWREAQQKKGVSPETGEALLERLLSARRAHWENAELQRLRAANKEPKDDKWKSRYVGPLDPEINDAPRLPDGWVWASVQQLAAHEERSITDGPFGSNLKTSHYTNSGPRVVRLQNIGDGVFIDDKAHISSKHFESLKEYAVYSGDLVIRALGTPAPRACKIPDSLGPAIVKADCIRLKVASKFVSPDYVLWALNSPGVRARTGKMIHGIGRPRLNLGEIKSIALPLPSITEQAEIVREVEQRFAAADRLVAKLDRQLELAHAARRSLLDEAFAGRLVSQNPKDQAASVLLERIRSDREIQGQKPKGGRMQKSTFFVPKIWASRDTRRSLLDVLQAQTAPITPEQLFREAGFEPSEVDLFYRELTALRKMLREQKPLASEALLWPHRPNVLLQLKKGTKK